MAEWYNQESRPFDLYETDNGLYYQAVGTLSNRERIEAIEIIKALDRIAVDEKNGENKIKGIRIRYGRIDGNLDIRDAPNLDLSEEKDSYYYIFKPPVAILFLACVFDGEVHFRDVLFGDVVSFIDGTQFRKIANFSRCKFEHLADFGNVQFGKIADFSQTRFVGIAIFSDVQFEEEANFSLSEFKETAFHNAKFGGYSDFGCSRFQFPVSFQDVKYWSDSPRITLARWLWKDGVWGKLLKCILFLHKNSPEGKPEKPAQFFLDRQNIDEVSNPLFKRYVADQQYIRSFQENHNVVYWLWRISCNCGRSLMLWAFWSLILALIFGLLYADFSCPSFLNDTFISDFLDWVDPKIKIGDTANNWFTGFYFSIVTFTTLGFGDVTPADGAGQFWITLEVILGYVMLGGLISIFANKLARRS